MYGVKLPYYLPESLVLTKFNNPDTALNL